MSSKTTNLGLTKPAVDEFYDVDVQNKNMDKIDAEIGGLENPSYEEADKTAKLVSGEKYTIAFGKIAKAISTLIDHISAKATSSVLGHVKLSDSTSSTSAASAGVAATPKAVKAAYDLANKSSEKIGTTDISGIGDGTLTGAVDALNQSMKSLNSIYYASEILTVQAGQWREYVFKNLPEHKLSLATIISGSDVSKTVGCYVRRDFTTTGKIYVYSPITQDVHVALILFLF